MPNCDAPTIEKTTKSYDAEIYLTTADFSSIALPVQSKHETEAKHTKNPPRPQQEGHSTMEQPLQPGETTADLF